MKHLSLAFMLLISGCAFGAQKEVPTIDNPRGLHIRVMGKIDAYMERVLVALFMLTTTYPPNQTIIIDIDSPGGQLNEAYRIMGALDALNFSSPNPTICVGHNTVASAAVSIFTACSLSVMHENATMFLHLPTIPAINPATGKEEMTSPPWLIERYSVSIGLTPKRFLELLTGPNKTRTLSAREAVRLGLADAIIFNPNKKEERNAQN